MKYFKILIIPIFLIAILSISCERDDICPDSTPTTPRLIIDLYNSESPENKKNVFDLVVAGVDNDFILSDYNFKDTNQIILPLKTDDNTTEYILIKEAFINDNDTPDVATDDYVDGNTDIITINYSREQVYVSRACGYKTIFKNVTISLDDDDIDDDEWIVSQQPLNPNQSVENEDETHFNILH